MPFLRLLALTAFLLLPLPQGHAATITANEPGWALQVLSWDLDKALPGVEYNYRVAVRGGVYPYTFALLDGPAGMTIHPRTGEIRWAPAAEAPARAVRVSITDTRNASLTHNFSVAAERSAFRFVAATGSNLNTGTEASPWATLAYASAHAGTSSYIYVKAGTYPEAMSINSSNCGRFLAYPGDAVTVIGTGSGSGSIWINGGNRLLFQGFTFDANDHRWLFSCDAGLLENVIWRKNTMHNAASDDWENPAFIFFWDGAQKPIQGQVHYRNIVMQENTFFDLANPNDHGASTTLYDVQDLLYEDNLAYAIDGRGVSDKDDGFRNTFRNNVVRDCAVGIGLYNQYSQGSIEIDHNLIYNCGTAVVLGGQPGYLRDVFMHHNTIAGSISSRGCSKSRGAPTSTSTATSSPPGPISRTRSVQNASTSPAGVITTNTRAGSKPRAPR
ncbi:MAG: right-handed parallel beta-helix repeat-containing protein [Opitutaceae bacterium]|nr:right-handed parallel beta-helix repeat-containing protein [Opitutaceae bacterium]